MTNKEVMDNNGNLSLQLYVKQATVSSTHTTEELIVGIRQEQKNINDSLDALFTQLKNIGIEL